MRSTSFFLELVAERYDSSIDRNRLNSPLGAASTKSELEEKEESAKKAVVVVARREEEGNTMS